MDGEIRVLGVDWRICCARPFRVSRGSGISHTDAASHRTFRDQ